MKAKTARRFIRRNMSKAIRFSWDKKYVPRKWFWKRWKRAMNTLKATQFKPRRKQNETGNL